MLHTLLPANTTSVTQLRDPLERILSAYEFSVEVAARFEGAAPNDTMHDNRTLTTEVWPWSSLVPMVQHDIAKRKEEVKRGMSRSGSRPPDHPYGNKHVMSLEDFVEHPLAKELLHNGQSYQVLGITSQSYWTFAASLRSCLQQDAALHTKASQIAAAALERFLHVGIFERLDESLSSLAAALRVDMALPPVVDAPPEASHQNASEADNKQPMQSLGRSYRGCVARSRRKNAARRTSALRSLGFHDNSRLTFSAATRARIPPRTLARIRELNQVDAALYAEGQRLLSHRVAEQKERGIFKPLLEKAKLDLATGSAPDARDEL
ncbi:hypothetical protein WJX74_004580 [Apatococcus lobatus]|uniref:Uncharacterized protein n=1 Tax=Apatococcus lobatus TaxID=904363 RepID=A0AAW1S6X9_9CHLO